MVRTIAPAGPLPQTRPVMTKKSRTSQLRTQFRDLLNGQLRKCPESQYQSRHSICYLEDLTGDKGILMKYKKQTYLDDIVLEHAEPDAESEPEEEEEDDADELAARKVTDKQIKAYWTAKEQARLAPRVHQGSLSLHEKCLREWDMQTRFGVSVSLLCGWVDADY